MLVKFHARGTGRGRGPVEYLLLDEEKRKAGLDYNDLGELARPGSELIRGDANRIIEIIDSIHNKQKYTSGVLSFEEADIKKEQKKLIMDEFEKTLMPGLSSDQYQILWVEHKDKGRLELNFLVANIELETGKSLNPYYHAIDLKRVNSWKDITNYKFKFSDPADPAKARLSSKGKTAKPVAAKEMCEKVNEYIGRLAAAGTIKDRADVLQALQKVGLKIGRETKNYISIENPNGKRNIKLQGSMYARDFNVSTESAGAKSERIQIYRESADERNRENKATYSALMRKRKEYNRHRYPRLTDKVYDFTGQPAMESMVDRLARTVRERKEQRELNHYDSSQPNSVNQSSQEHRIDPRLEIKPTDSPLRQERKINAQKQEQLTRADPTAAAPPPKKLANKIKGKFNGYYQAISRSISRARTRLQRAAQRHFGGNGRNEKRHGRTIRRAQEAEIIARAESGRRARVSGHGMQPMP